MLSLRRLKRPRCIEMGLFVCILIANILGVVHWSRNQEELTPVSTLQCVMIPSAASFPEPIQQSHINIFYYIAIFFEVSTSNCSILFAIVFCRRLSCHLKFNTDILTITWAFETLIISSYYCSEMKAIVSQLVFQTCCMCNEMGPKRIKSDKIEHHVIIRSNVTLELSVSELYSQLTSSIRFVLLEPFLRKAHTIRQ